VTAALLDDLAAAGVRLSLAGDALRYQTRPGVSIAPYRERITTNRSAFIALLGLQDEMVSAASAARGAFDRAAYDALWVRWNALAARDDPANSW
jgi:hypothetical protein